MNFLYGIVFTILLLIFSVFVRRYIRKTKAEKYHSKGGNSRESVGENVVAVLKGDNNRTIKESWIDKFERRLRGN